MMKARYALLTSAGLLLSAAGLGAACMPAKADPVGKGEVLFANCTPCHGDNGHGNCNLGAPAIAGMETWYVEAQLKKFRLDHRGYHGDDLEGLRMKPMAKILASDEQVSHVAAYVAGLKPKPFEATVLDGNAARGANEFARCTMCHGTGGQGNKIMNAPSLAGTEDWYLLRSLRKYKAGQRGAAEGDGTGALMRAQASMFKDEQAMRDVVAHIQKLSSP